MTGAVIPATIGPEMGRHTMLDIDHIDRQEAVGFAESLDRMRACDHPERDVVDGLVFCAGCRGLLFERP